MDPVVLLALGVVAGLLALFVAWKLTWFLLRALLWLLGLGIVGVAVWWFFKHRQSVNPAARPAAGYHQVWKASPIPTLGPSVAA